MHGGQPMIGKRFLRTRFVRVGAVAVLATAMLTSVASAEDCAADKGPLDTIVKALLKNAKRQARSLASRRAKVTLRIRAEYRRDRTTEQETFEGLCNQARDGLQEQFDLTTAVRESIANAASDYATEHPLVLIDGVRMPGRLRFGSGGPLDRGMIQFAHDLEKAQRKSDRESDKLVRDLCDAGLNITRRRWTLDDSLFGAGDAPPLVQLGRAFAGAQILEMIATADGALEVMFASSGVAGPVDVALFGQPNGPILPPPLDVLTIDVQDPTAIQHARFEGVQGGQTYLVAIGRLDEDLLYYIADDDAREMYVPLPIADGGGGAGGTLFPPKAGGYIVMDGGPLQTFPEIFDVTLSTNSETNEVTEIFIFTRGAPGAGGTMLVTLQDLGGLNAASGSFTIENGGSNVDLEYVPPTGIGGGVRHVDRTKPFSFRFTFPTDITIRPSETRKEGITVEMDGHLVPDEGGKSLPFEGLSRTSDSE